MVIPQESAEILRWLPTAFNSILPADKAAENLYPTPLRPQIDTISEWMQRDLNIGVYKAGFATTQADYDAGVVPVFAALNKLEELIASNGGPFILGQQMTELDVRAYATIIRFDVVYVQHFKCNLGMIRWDYPVIGNWLKGMYERVVGCKESTEWRHIKENVSFVKVWCDRGKLSANIGT
jgi:putative glutathione S-transferase